MKIERFTPEGEEDEAKKEKESGAKKELSNEEHAELEEEYQTLKEESEALGAEFWQLLDDGLTEEYNEEFALIQKLPEGLRADMMATRGSHPRVIDFMNTDAMVNLLARREILNNVSAPSPDIQRLQEIVNNPRRDEAIKLHSEDMKKVDRMREITRKGHIHM